MEGRGRMPHKKKVKRRRNVVFMNQVPKKGIPHKKRKKR